MKNSWRKLIVLLVSLTMGLAFGACSDDDENGNGNGTPDACNDECTGAHEVCNESAEACECDTGYEYDGSGACVKENGNGNGTPDACNDECTGAHEVCNESTEACECDAGHEYDANGACVPDNGTPDACNDECTGEHEVCNESTEACECEAGYEYDGSDACVPEDAADYARLHDSIQEPVGMNCDYGGTALRTGLDTNENGTLDADEVDGVNLICNQHPNGPGPIFLVDIETLAPGDVTCPDGGTVTHSGYDDSGDGILDADEIESSVVQCNTDACDGTSPLITQIVEVEPADYGAYDVGETKQVAIHLSRELDESSANVSQFGEAFAPTADFDWEISASDASIVIVPWIVTDQWHNTKLAISDACGLTIPQVSLSAGSEGPETRVYTNTDPIEVGQDVEVCWESRLAVSCEIDTGTYSVPDVSALPSTDGCINVPVEASDINGDMYMGPKVKCSNAAGHGYSDKLNVWLTPTLDFFYSTGLNIVPAVGGQVNLGWGTSKMETCELLFNGQTTTVPVNADLYPLHVTESGQLTLTCTDADAEVYHADQPVFVVAGQGFTNANVHPIQDQGGNVLLSVSLNSTYMADSTCEGTLTYEGDTVSLDIPVWDVGLPPQDHVANFTYNETLTDLTYASSHEAELSITCTTADASFSQTFTHTY